VWEGFERVGIDGGRRKLKRRRGESRWRKMRERD